MVHALQVDSNMLVSARGGDGGNGGRGGDGATGSNGSNGSDATEFFSGTSNRRCARALSGGDSLNRGLPQGATAATGATAVMGARAQAEQTVAMEVQSELR